MCVCLEWSLQKITIYALLESARDNKINKIKKKTPTSRIQLS